jgi:hypothetical protein
MSRRHRWLRLSHRYLVVSVTLLLLKSSQNDMPCERKVGVHCTADLAAVRRPAEGRAPPGLRRVAAAGVRAVGLACAAHPVGQAAAPHANLAGRASYISAALYRTLLCILVWNDRTRALDPVLVGVPPVRAVLYPPACSEQGRSEFRRAGAIARGLLGCELSWGVDASLSTDLDTRHSKPWQNAPKVFWSSPSM